MKSTCDTVAERIALGESLGDVAEHAATCERCRRLVALPVELGVVHSEVDPGLGFTARMTAGAQHRIAVRKRRRIATGIAGAMVASAVAVVVMTHQPESDLPTTSVQRPNPATDTNNQKIDTKDDTGEPDPDELQLVQFATNYDVAIHPHADWKSIEKPLAPYGELLEGKFEP